MRGRERRKKEGEPREKEEGGGRRCSLSLARAGGWRRTDRRTKFLYESREKISIWSVLKNVRSGPLVKGPNLILELGPVWHEKLKLIYRYCQWKTSRLISRRRGRGRRRGAERGRRRIESTLLSISLSRMKTDERTDKQSFYMSHGRKPPFGRFRLKKLIAL